MADSFGAFYQALSQNLASFSPVASYVTLYYAIQLLLQKLEVNRSDPATTAQVSAAVSQLEVKKKAFGPLQGCKSQYEVFLRQSKIAGDQNYPQLVQALKAFGELSDEWKSEANPESFPAPKPVPKPDLPLSRPDPNALSPSAADFTSTKSLNTSARSIARSKSPASTLRGDQMQVLEQAKRQVNDAVQELEFKKVLEGRRRLEDALRLLNQIG